MVYYLSPNRAYGISDMSLDNLKKHEVVGGVKALHLLIGVPVVVFMLFNIYAIVSKPAYLCDDAASSAEPCLHKGKVTGYGLLAALVAGLVSLAVVKVLPDNRA